MHLKYVAWVRGGNLVNAIFHSTYAIFFFVLFLSTLYALMVFDQIGDTLSDSASELWKKNYRKLPSEPISEAPFTASSVTKKLAESKLTFDNKLSSSSSYNSKVPLRASSSLETTTGAYNNTSGVDRIVSSSLAERISPYSGLGDVASLINNPSTIAAIAEAVAASSGATPAPPLTTNLRAGKPTTGSLLEQVTNRSLSRGPVISMPNSRPHSPHTAATSGFTNTILSRGGVSSGNSQFKTLKEQLKDELKSAVEERRALLDGRISCASGTPKPRLNQLKDPTFHRKSENDLHALFDIYSSVPDAAAAAVNSFLPTNSPLSRAGVRSRNYTLSDSALAQFSPVQEDLPPGFYKSHGYDTTGFTSVLDELDPLRRPYSSLASAGQRYGGRGSHAMATTGLGHMDLSLMDPDLDGNGCFYFYYYVIHFI